MSGAEFCCYDAAAKGGCDCPVPSDAEIDAIAGCAGRAPDTSEFELFFHDYAAAEAADGRFVTREEALDAFNARETA